MKTRPSKSKNFPILSPSLILSCTITKKSQKVNLWHKSHWRSWGSCGSSLKELFRCHSDSALFMFFIDRILFRFLVIGVFFESSVIESSSGSTVIDSSPGSSMLFSRHVAIFLSNRATTLFLSKTDVLFYIHYNL